MLQGIKYVQYLYQNKLLTGKSYDDPVALSAYILEKSQIKMKSGTIEILHFINTKL